MIRYIRGKVIETGLVSVVVEVAGFGIQVFTAAPQALAIGREAQLATYLAVKQDGMDLYGFADAADRDFFEKLLSVSGIGPKTALSYLRRAPRAALEGAIAKRNLAYLTKVVGIGKKSAEKLMVELSERVGAATHSDADSEVFDTLLALGYTEREARKALQAIPENAAGKEARLKAALSSGQ